MKPIVSYPSFWLNENANKGYLFEQWVVSQFPDSAFILKEWRSDKHIGRRSADSGRNPDLLFQVRDSEPKLFFAIECKFRSQLISGHLDWAKEYQLDNYYNFEISNKIQVFIALGLGGMPHRPDTVSMIPFSELSHSTFISGEVLEKYKTNRLDLSIQSALIDQRSFIPRG